MKHSLTVLAPRIASKRKVLIFGWDSYGAERLKDKAAAFSIQLMTGVGFGGPSPHVSPTPDGDLRMEWTRGGHELVITVTVDGEVNVTLDCGDDDVNEWDATVFDDLRVAEALQDFAR